MRKLASIQRVEEILPIEGADLIEKVRIKGWWCVAKKGEFKSGDSCVYFEIDSLLPNIPQFEFLGKGRTLKKSLLSDGQMTEGYRLKTAKLRGQISQGLALPLSFFPEIGTPDIGQDVSQQLHIYKYDPQVPAYLAAGIKGPIPGFIPVTDEERIQSCIEVLEKYKCQRFYRTSKVDGTSSTFYKLDNQFGVCAHKVEFEENNGNDYWKIANQYQLKNRLTEGFAIQAEVAGEKIENNRLSLKGVDAFVFYIFDINKWQYLKLDDMKAFVKDLGMKTVPILDENFILNHSCDELLNLADAQSELNSDCLQEGTVIRLYDSTEKISFKVISNKYLIKWGL